MPSHMAQCLASSSHGNSRAFLTRPDPSESLSRCSIICFSTTVPSTPWVALTDSGFPAYSSFPFLPSLGHVPNRGALHRMLTEE